MAATDIREKAKEVRAERASSLKSFFSNCFVPEPTLSETTNNDIENTMDSENDILENAAYSENTLLENTTRIENNTIGNAIHSDNGTRENDIYSENAIYCGKTVKLAESLGFTALGVLAVLIDEFPSGKGMLNVTQLAKACGVARTTLIAQLRSLEKCAIITLGNAEKVGRHIEILCIGNTTYSDNAIS
jgi:GTP-sensing pleiotropic transcriptional regulator CodY